MSSSATGNSSGSKNKKEKEQQEIVNTFQKMRDEQRAVASKATELQMEQKSHELVIETLKEVEKDRKCFRMIGGVLVERTVAEVLPALEQNRDQLTKVIESLSSQVVSKGKEINDYREKHNIKFQGEMNSQESKSATQTDSGTNSKSSGGVLVSASS